MLEKFFESMLRSMELDPAKFLLEEPEFQLHMIKLGLGRKEWSDQALGALHILVQRGEAAAQSQLGLLHFHGNHVPMDRTRAFQLWEQAASKGDFMGINNLGHCYLYGEGASRTRPGATN